MDLVPKIARRYFTTQIWLFVIAVGLVPIASAQSQLPNYPSGNHSSLSGQQQNSSFYASANSQTQPQLSNQSSLQTNNPLTQTRTSNPNLRPLGTTKGTNPQSGSAKALLTGWNQQSAQQRTPSQQPAAQNRTKILPQNRINLVAHRPASQGSSGQLQRPSGRTSIGIQVTPASARNDYGNANPQDPLGLANQKDNKKGQDFLDRAIPQSGSQMKSEGRKENSTTGFQPIVQAGIGLAVVLPLIVICMFVMKKATPKGMLGLPAEAIEVLGNTALDAKHHLKLIRLGKKLVLLSVTDGNVQPVSEVEDPEEVQRLVAMCQNKTQREVTQTFQSVLQQGEQDRSTGFLGSQQDRLGSVVVDRQNGSRRGNSNHFYEA